MIKLIELVRSENETTLKRRFGFEGRIWDLIVSVPDHCLSFYLVCIRKGFQIKT